MTTIPIFDRVFKVLARDYAASFLRLALPDVSLRLVGLLENVELTLPDRRVDFLHRVEDDEGAQYLFHIEFQTYHEADLPRRLFVYSAMLTEQFDLPVVTVALYLSRRQSPTPEWYRVQVGDLVTNQFTYLTLPLWEYEADIRAGRRPELAPLLITMAGEPTAEVLALERTLILQEPDARKRADLLACAVSIGARYFERDFLWRFFREEVEMMREATFIDDWIEEGVQRGVERGMEKGLEKGLRQGLQQGLQHGLQQGARLARLETLVQILTHRFGSLPSRVRARLSDLDAVQLERLIDAALDADSLSDFEETLIRLIVESQSK
jgi:predicted transposase YdaD